MELIAYSIENKNTFWVHLGYNICKLRVDFDKIYTNIGEYNFPKTNRYFGLFFYYVRPDNIFSHMIHYLNNILNKEYRFTEYIQYNEQNINTRSVFYNITEFILPEYNYTKIYRKQNYKSITRDDFIFIQETFDNFKQILDFITIEVISRELDNIYCMEEKIKLHNEINKSHNRINRLRNYLSEIVIRDHY